MQGRMPPYDVHVSYPQPAYVARYRELAPARFHFSSERLPGARMVLATDILSRTLPMASCTRSATGATAEIFAGAAA